MVFAAIFGAGQVTDAFRIAFTIPNLTRDLFAEGALSSAFVPVFTEYLSTKNKEEAARLANLVASSIILIVGGICLMGAIFAEFLVLLMAPGFQEDPEKLALTVSMTRIMFPFLLLVALAAQAMGILNACNRFGVPATASTMFNIVSLVAGLLLGKAFGPWLGISEIHGMAYGIVIGGAAQLVWQIPSLRSAGFRFRFSIDRMHPGVRRILLLMGPAILGNAAVQINVAVNSNLASRLGDGPVSWLGYAFRFMQLPIGIFGYAIASATLPAISRNAAANDTQAFRETLSRSLGLVFLLTVPSAVGLAVMGESIIAAIYQWNKFTAADTRQTAQALAFYAIGLAGYAAAKVLNPAFYALGDARTPMAVSLSSVLINFTVAYSVVQFAGFGHAGLALSTSTVAIFSSVALFIIMRKRIGGIYGRNLWRSFSRVTLASAVMGTVVWGTSHFIRATLGIGKAAQLLNLAIAIPLGIAVLWFACRALRIAELETAMNALAGPLRRRMGMRSPK